MLAKKTLMIKGSHLSIRMRGHDADILQDWAPSEPKTERAPSRASLIAGCCEYILA